jgi:hypothetical protein
MVELAVESDQRIARDNPVFVVDANSGRQEMLAAIQ